jgi:DNA-binding CsgD family transcriptional regulator
VSPNSEVAAQLDAAAKTAAARGAPQVAAELLELALELTPREEPRARIERLLAAAGAHFEAGEVSRADELTEEALEATRTGHLRAAALRLAAQVKSRTASFDQSVRLASEALTVEAGGLALITSIHLDLVFYLTSLGDFAGALPHAEVALENAASLGLDALEAQALAVRTVIRFLGGQGVSEDDLARALALEVSDHPCPVVMRPTMIASLLTLWSGRPDEAKQSLDKQRLEAIERGAESDGALLVLYVVWAQVWKGDIAGALTTGAEALRAAIAIEDKIALALAYSADALASAYCGEEARARADAEQAAGLFSAMGWRSGAIWSSWALGLLELSLGDNQAVDAVLGPMASVIGNMTALDPVLAVFVPDHAEALIRLGEYARAETLIDAFERQARELDRTWALAAAARCRGLLAGARGDLNRGVDCLAEALVLHDAAGLPVERARSLLELGRLLRRQKQRRRARLTLEQAHDAFTEMGAPVWAGRCEVELARVARPSPPSGLTATEETIAKLAADGLTNRAIAARSFVTVKTVEANLARAYRKLGISSRAQLARALDGQQSVPS